MSSVCHLFISTLPFLILFSYFIYSASRRPSVLDEWNENDKEDLPVLIPLYSMLQMFLAMLLLWTVFTVYLGCFVGRRRKLMEKYSIGKEDGVLTVVGDVFYERPKGCAKLVDKCYHTDLATVSYPYPGEKMTIEKKIRTYHPYHREKVSILVLPHLPFSGQPLADVERDMMSYQSEYAVRNQDKITQVLFVCFVWSTICITGALYILHQMVEVNNRAVAGEEEDVDEATLLFWVMILVVIPIISIFGNYVQWTLYKTWVINGGSAVSKPTKVPPKTVTPEELYNDEEGGFSFFT
mmetsp:Transcript_17101/g.20880  ORF Transcript_17101/g.20880 Transcript_17101/m.20880 type:complete len:295 (-) Transcript_17101:150-1034(-)